MFSFRGKGIVLYDLKIKLLNVFKRCCLSSNLYDRGLFLTFAYTQKKWTLNFPSFMWTCVYAKWKVSSDGALYSNKILFICVDPTTCNLSFNLSRRRFSWNGEKKELHTNRTRSPCVFNGDFCNGYSFAFLSPVHKLITLLSVPTLHRSALPRSCLSLKNWTFY